MQAGFAAVFSRVMVNVNLGCFTRILNSFHLYDQKVLVTLLPLR